MRVLNHWYGTSEIIDYQEGKRSVEAALIQAYPNQVGVSIRFPYVVGPDDYTNRLAFYVDHILNEKPMFINNLTEPIGFISSSEAGKFLAWVIEGNMCSTMNASSNGTFTLKKVIDYIESRTGKTAILDRNGEAAPYNDTSFSVNTDVAKSAGFEFSNIEDWMYGLLDFYVDELRP